MTEHSSHSGVAALIVAAGRGSRTGFDMPKQYVDIAGEPVLRRTIRAFQACPLIGLIQIVTQPGDETLYHDAIGGLPPIAKPVAGGATRQESVMRGLEALQAASPDTVLIHDAARPFVSCDLLERIIAAVGPETGVVPVLAVTDTVRRTSGRILTDTVARDDLYAMQTPQAFPFQQILRAHRLAAEQGRQDLTDDAAVFQLTGMNVHRIAGDRGNIKLTTPEDFAYAEHMVLSARELRTGQGYDVHAFEAGDGLYLCGVAIPFDRKLRGHSDADVGLHALTDALFGAMADGDIGSHFPPSDPQWKDRASEVFLRYAMDRLAARGGRFVNVDVTLVCEMPKIGPHRNAMRERIAEICDIDAGRVSVKATTSERLGFTGRGEGIAATAIANIELPAER